MSSSSKTRNAVAKKGGSRLLRTFKRMAMFVLAAVWVVIHDLLDKVINFVFSLIYDDSQKQRIPEIKNPILLKSASSLAAAIRKRELTSVVVVKAFIERIQEVNGILNAVVDNRFEESIKDAENVDKLLDSGAISEKEAEQTKPFLGVPFTTKESTSCKGMNFSMGMVARKGLKAEDDADVIKLMKEAGGILIAISNVPELNLWCETRCNVYGQTCNPYNTTRTVGGSSGGEAAIIASCGSPIGIGTDIGGSIRMPAFYCGVYGHKPTTGLTSIKGISFRTGLEVDSMVCCGPMSKFSEDLEPFLRVMVGNKIGQIQLDSKVNLKELHILYAEESGDMRASSVTWETKQIMAKAVHHLETISTYPVEKLDLSGFKSCFRIWRYWMTKEGGNFARDITNRQSEVNVWQELPRMLLGQSTHTLPALLKLLDTAIFPAENSEWAESTKARLQDELMEKLGRNGVLLFPSHPFPASYHYTSFLRPYNFGYWAIFNVLKFPVTQVPLGLSKEGLPLGIQVVAAPFQDHLCLAVARELEKAFGGWVAPCPVKKQ
ncbi:fatty-acid amide hydrolase 2 isoform X1 [Frankliniella occidentalis]|uniref:Fatty-acid amide hydrolase 2 isoform X1 n=2 Tax=Frankliniella occidentalis TaxID=133901 RepID=A0A6J1T9W2_FRAOC|nr:fatty-acid amide hydrolase 2 isoform X1 [Frankliniella occidentalis]